jgi:hypothetical protein
MAWYIAKSLEVLRAQLNARAPARSTVSDGGIGDASHSARESDHNPTETGQVCARDFTNDPAGGMAGQWLADALVASRDPRIKYVIWNHRIIDSRAGQHPWQWMPYSGANDHTHHVHVSVFAGALGDDTRSWNLGGADQGDDVTPEQMKQILDAIGGVPKAVWNEPLQNALDPGWSAARDILRFGHFEAGKGRRELAAANAGILAAIAAGTDDPGITEARMEQIVNDAVAQHVQITGTVQIGPKGDPA